MSAPAIDKAMAQALKTCEIFTNSGENAPPIACTTCMRSTPSKAGFEGHIAEADCLPVTVHDPAG